MGNFNLKNIWAPKTGGGGNVPANLEQRVQNLENDTFKLGANTGHQIVRHSADFFSNVVFKNEAFVDRIGNGNTNIVNKQYVDTKDNQNVKLTGDQSIAGVKTFTGTGEVIKLNSGRDDSAYMAGYKSNNRRIWYFGKGSSSNDEFVIGSTSNIKLEAANIIHCNSKKLTNVAEPAANTDAATKQYVDNRITYREVATNINASSTYSVEPTSGYRVINVLVARKRSNDGMYFFDYQTTLNKQVFLGSDNKFKIYNQGNVSGFSNNEFKILITEMKV